MNNIIYGMITSDTTAIANDRSIKKLVVGEIVRVISVGGTIAIIKPYNSRKMYAVNLAFLNTTITQNTKDYRVMYGIRKLKC